MKILMVGATSVIAHETAKQFAREGAELFLVGRSMEKLKIVQDDLIVHGAKKVEIYVLDLLDLSKHEAMLDRAVGSLEEIHLALIAHGTFLNPKLCEQNVLETLKEFQLNCVSTVSILTHLANHFEKQRKGCIAVIASVAGDRCRKSNYVYGAAKGAVAFFLQGLRYRLHKSQVRVLTLKLGLVDTPMTAHKKKNLLFATPGYAGQCIYKAVKGSSDIVYIPWFWSPVMQIIKWIPERIFKTLNL